MTARDYRHHGDTFVPPSRHNHRSDPRREGEDRKPAPMTELEVRAAADYARHSLGVTHNLMWDTLVVPCNTHGVNPSKYCFGSEASGVRGVCRNRLEKGQRAAARPEKLRPQPSMLLHQLVVRPVPPRRWTESVQP
jgi:hypothetical protein